MSFFALCVCKCVCMCVSYCFHEWSDVTAFPWFWAAYVTLGLKDIQVQVIDIARWALKCTVQTHVSIQTKLCTHTIQNYQYFFFFVEKYYIQLHLLFRRHCVYLPITLWTILIWIVALRNKCQHTEQVYRQPFQVMKLSWASLRMDLSDSRATVAFRVWQHQVHEACCVRFVPAVLVWNDLGFINSRFSPKGLFLRAVKGDGFSFHDIKVCTSILMLHLL